MNYRSLLIACLATLGLAVASWGQADGKIAIYLVARGVRGRVDYECGWERAPVNLTQGRHGQLRSPNLVSRWHEDRLSRLRL